MEYLLYIHEVVGFKRLVSIIQYSRSVSEDHQNEESHRGDIFEAKNVLVEVISNETGVLVVEVKVLISPISMCYLYIVQDVCPL